MSNSDTLPQKGNSFLGTLKKIVRKLGILLAFVTALVLISLLIVYPLWIFATAKSKLFSIFILYVFSGGMTFFVIRKIIESSRIPKEISIPITGRKTVVRLLLTTPFLYSIILLFSDSNFLIAIPLTIVYLSLLAFVILARRKLNV